jgi:zona occludens toxin
VLTVITGIPGSGKTLYTVDKLLRSILTTTIKHTAEDGTVSDVPRRILSNINGLLIDHEKIGPGSPMTYNGKTDKWEQSPGDRQGVNNWHEWAKAGDVIVFDEVQKPWPLAATGSKVPPYIEALETHRHMGVDFILMTQHPMMIHANIVRLCGRHLHMRRLGNMGFSTVYEWDGCSRTLIYKSCMAKFPYRYGKAAFELYKSAEVHTKLPRKMPSLIYGVLFGLVALAIFAPAVTSRLKERLNPTPVVLAKKAPQTKYNQVVLPAAAPASAAVAAQAAVLPISNLPPSPVFAGCAKFRNVCRCYDSQAEAVEKPADFCQSRTSPAIFATGVQHLLASTSEIGPADTSASDLDLISWVNRKNQKPAGALAPQRFVLR